jgi:hypothetical protein
MTDDLERRLRGWRTPLERNDEEQFYLRQLLDEAADEIARLRAENEALKRAAVTAVLPLEALLLVGNVREQHSPELWEGIGEGAQAVRAALKGSRHE